MGQRQDEVTVTVGDRRYSDRLLRSGASAHEPNLFTGQVARDQADGAPLVLIERMPLEEMAVLRQAFMAFPSSTVLRAAGVRNAAATFGYTCRSPVMQRYECRACAAAEQAPEAHDAVTAASTLLFALLEDRLPEVAQRTAEEAAVVDEQWRMHGSPWTSGVLNTTSPLPYHYDRNNLPAWSAMIVARRGVRGGHLHIPQLTLAGSATGLTLDCRDGDVVFFPGWRYMHGVTPMHVIERNAYRFTAVYYSIARMRHCLDPAEELAEGRRARTAAEDRMVEGQRASGMMT